MSPQSEGATAVAKFHNEQDASVTQLQISATDLTHVANKGSLTTARVHESRSPEERAMAESIHRPGEPKS